MKTGKKILSMLLAVVMVISMMPAMAFAADPVAKIGDTPYDTLDAAFAAAVSGDTVTVLQAGTYALNTSGKNITITGAVDGVVFEGMGAKNMGGASVTFNNVTFNWTNANYKGLQHSGDLVYNNCVINGQPFLYGTSETFTNCTFNQTSADAYNVWTYGAKEVVFEGCTFNCVGKSVLVYTEATSAYTNVTVNDCEFIASAPVEGKAAIEIDTSLSSGATIVIDEDTTATGFGTGNVSGNSLWNDKKSQDDAEIIVGGEKMWPPELPKAIANVLDVADLSFALNFTVDYADYTEEELMEIFNFYKDYFVDFELTFNKPVTLNADGSADGYLSGQYDAWSPDSWVNVPFEDVSLAAGEPLRIMDYAAMLMGQWGLRLRLYEIIEFVQDFDCGVYLTPEYLAANPDLKVTLSLNLYKPAFQYDGNSDVNVCPYGEAETLGTYVFPKATYTIKYNAGEGQYIGTLPNSKAEWLMLKNAYTVDMPVTLYDGTDFVRTGYTIVGWTIGGVDYALGETVNVNFTTVKGGTVQAYAIWAPITYSIRYNANGGQYEGNLPNSKAEWMLKKNAYTYDAPVTLYDGADFVRTGYTIVGWTIDGVDYALGETVNKNFTTVKGGTVQAYAIWAPITYSIRYNANGGQYEGNLPNSKAEWMLKKNAYTYDAPVTLYDGTDFVRAGYTIAGWTIGGVDYALGETVNVNFTTVKGGTVQAYAIWQANEYTVTLDAGEGSVDPTSITVTYDAPIEGLPEASRRGYKFLGWLDESGNAVANGDKYTVAGDSTYTANWEQVVYNITVNAGEGGTVTVQSSSVYGVVVPLSIVPDTGYKVVKAELKYIGSNGTPVTTKLLKDDGTVAERFMMPAADVEVVVEFEKILYNITINEAEGGKVIALVNGVESTTAYYGDEVVFVVTPDEGWALSSMNYQIFNEGSQIGGGNAAGDPEITMPAGDVVVKPVFEKIVYNITVAASEHGTVIVKVNGVEANTATIGDEITFEVVPDEGYSLAKLNYSFTFADGSGAGGGVAADDTLIMRAGDLRISPKFKANEYTLTLNANGGKVDPASITVTYDAAIGELPVPTKSKATFLGWYDAEGNEVTAQTIYKVAGDSTIIAKWLDHPSVSNVTNELFTIQCTEVHEHSWLCNWFGSHVKLVADSVKWNEELGRWEAQCKIGSSMFTQCNASTTKKNYFGGFTHHYDETDFVMDLYFDPDFTGLSSSKKEVTGMWLPVKDYVFDVYCYTSPAAPDLSKVTATIIWARDTVNKNSTHSQKFTVKQLTEGGYTVGEMYSKNGKFYVDVTVTDLSSYIKALGEKTGKNYVLPAWEKHYDAAADFSFTLEYTGSTTDYKQDGTGWAVAASTWANNTEKLNGKSLWLTEQVTVKYTDGMGGSIFADESYTVNAVYENGKTANAVTDFSATATPAFQGNYERTGYTFDGWTPEWSATVSADVTYVASWYANSYVLTLNPNGGNELNPNTVAVTFDQVIGELPTPERVGHRFDGWYYGDTEITAETVYTWAEDITITAKWLVNEYTVRFNGNGGEGSMDDQARKYQDGAALPANAFTKTGYSFAGWNTAADGSGTSYADGASDTLTAEHNVVVELYAQWAANEYTVSFDANGGEAVADITVIYDSAYGTLPTATREGYTFIGWTLNGEAVTAETIVKTAADHTLVAVWEANEYTVSFDAGEGTVEPASKTVTFDAAYGELPVAQREGYDFMGWTLDGEEVTAETIVKTADDHSLTAVWQIKVFTVTFDSNGGSEVASQQVEWSSTATKPADPTREGYVFRGWLLDGEQYDFATPVKGDITLVAKWNQVLIEIPTEDDDSSDVPETPDAPAQPELPFKDIDPNADYYDELVKVYQSGIMNGTGADKFEPDTTLSRAMVATILYRLSGEKYEGEAASFKDVAEGQWYSEAIAWAASKGIVKGYDAERFGPMDNVTREQTAAMLLRYAQYKGLDVSASEMNTLLGYEDASSVSNWALTGMQFAIGEGLMTGTTEKTLDPQDDMTRILTAVAVARLMD